MANLKTLLRSLQQIKDPVAQRIAAFNHVQQIPYAISEVATPEDVLAQNQGDCGTKTALLQLLFKHLGYKTRRLLMRYRLPDFPEEVRFIPDQIDYHHALEVKIGRFWVAVDAAYDPPLRQLGFDVQIWDGISSMFFVIEPLAIKREGECNEVFDAEFEAFVQKLDEACEKYPKELAAYSKKLNKLFVAMRLRQSPE